MTTLTVRTDAAVEDFCPLFSRVFNVDISEAKSELSALWNEVIPFTAEDEGEIVSQLLAFPFYAKNARGLYLYAIATDENHRHRGLMRRLLSFTEKWAEENGYGFTFLIPASQALSDMYRALGYTEKIQICAGAYPENAEDAFASASLTLYAFDGDYKELCDGTLLPYSFEYAIKSYPCARLFLTDGGFALVHLEDKTKILALSDGVRGKITLNDAQFALAKGDNAKIPKEIFSPLPR